VTLSFREDRHDGRKHRIPGGGSDDGKRIALMGERVRTKNRRRTHDITLRLKKEV